jgi:UDP-glucose:(heptosyl)LPS alpha-1,3-glucosyltransferase
VIFAGRREDVERYYGAADLLALPSLQEAFGNVVLEALAAGLPVLVSKDVGAAEILSGELRQGIIDRPDDPLEVESKLLAMLEPSRRHLLAGEAARVGKAYSWDAHFRKLEGCLIEAADANGRARVA